MNVGTNEQQVLKLNRANRQITAKEVAASLSLSIRQREQIIAALQTKGLIRRLSPTQSEYREITG